MEIKGLRDVKGYFIQHKTEHFFCTESAQAVHDYNDYNKIRLEVNMSTIFTALIKEAARCNRYSSDVIYDIGSVNTAFESFQPEADLPFFVFGFRRDGVDGNSFVKSRMEGRKDYELYKEYFALYFVEVVEDEEYKGFYRVEARGYYL